ncbi:ThuA domain-containing protein [Dyadobacter crusticola]|uniref:ThuA domain-containing protein n=1 Tax=Dyadobacter crusticola TaxID=292407 RepID=UPI0004E27C1C|nr:ThuA domain-containing protein [Dyadobacter crusticola]
MHIRATVTWLLQSLFLLLFIASSATLAQKQKPFKTIAFFTGKNDQAHISFAREAHQFFPEAGRKMGFTHDSTSNWDNMNEAFLANYDVVIFLDTRPEKPEQRAAFEKYVRNGGGWLGFHFSAFALTPSAYPQNWDWYHNEFLGSGQYKSNTWRPTAAFLKVENTKNPLTTTLPAVFKSAPNEWYRWENELKNNPDIEILLSIDPSSFPLGTGPKQHEIWHSGYYPVAWTNKKYKMVYMNMGHNDIDYENKTNKDLSLTFENKTQSKFVINALMWLGTRKK